MTSSQRIILNTLATYGRTVFAMALGLFGSRWVLQSLGSVDYGLMSVVGGLIVFITFLNAITATSCARFFALSIGKGDSKEANRWFNTALSIHVIFPFVLILLGWPAGEWVIGNFLNIPPGRLLTAHWVFRFSLVSAFFGMCFTPYMAMYTAKQNIVELSLWGIANTVVNFGFVFWLTTYKGDAWLVYSGWTVAISVLLGVGQVLRARAIFPECRISFSLWWCWLDIRQVFSFAAWSFLGASGALFRNNGTALLFNKFFPPKVFPDVNAAFSIGNVVSGQAQTLSNALNGAFIPAIISAEGAGNRQQMITNTLRVTKFSSCLLMFFAVPLFCHMEYVLDLWLKNPPKSSEVFCRCMLIIMLIDNLLAGVYTAIAAVGRIAVYQISLLIMVFVLLIFVLLGFMYGATAIFTVKIFIVHKLVCLGITLFFAKRLCDFPVRVYFLKNFLPCCSVAGLFVLLGEWFAKYLTGSFLMVCCSIAIQTILFIPVVWWFIFEESERNYFVKMFLRLAGRLA